MKKQLIDDVIISKKVDEEEKDIIRENKQISDY